MSITLLQLDPSLTSSIPELDRQPTPEQIDLFRRSGVGVVRGLLRLEEIEQIREAYMEASEGGPIEGLSETRFAELVEDDQDPLLLYPRMLHPHRHPDTPYGKLALDFMLDSRIGNVLEAVTGEPPLAAQSMFYYKSPGARGQALHQDNNPLAVDPGTCMAAWIPLDRCDAANGALSVVPGTGPLEMLCDVERENRTDIFFNGGSIKLPEDITPITADMNPGDVLFFNGQLVHGSYPNTTKERWRRTLIFHYAPQSCDEIAEFYHPLLNMDGEVVERGVSPKGGPCGKFEPMSMGAMSSMRCPKTDSSGSAGPAKARRLSASG